MKGSIPNDQKITIINLDKFISILEDKFSSPWYTDPTIWLSVISLSLALLGAYITIRTYIISRQESQYRSLHEIFRNFLIKDLEFRDAQIPAPVVADLVSPQDSKYELQGQFRIRPRSKKAIVRSIRNFEIQRPLRIDNLDGSDRNHVIHELRKVDPVLLRLIALKLYTMEEIFNSVFYLCDSTPPKLKKIYSRIFMLGRDRFSDVFRREWLETLRYHIQCDPILTARGLVIYGSCYSREFMNFCLFECKMEKILRELGASCNECTCDTETAKSRVPPMWLSDYDIFVDDNKGSRH